jgi:hypothetical protein
VNSNTADASSDLPQRKCRECGFEKNVTEFRPAKLARNGKLYPRHQCRACENSTWRDAWRAGKKGRLSAATLAVNAPHIAEPMLGGGKAKLEDLVYRRMQTYGCDALDALHDLAMMPISENSMLNRIKLAAASELAGPLTLLKSADAPENLGKALHDLDMRYHATAARIKALRERIISPVR